MKSKVALAGFGTVFLICSSLVLGELSPAEANSSFKYRAERYRNEKPRHRVPVPLLVPGMIALGASLARKRKASTAALNASLKAE